MCDEWMRRLTFPMPVESFGALPRHAAFKYEYFGGAAQLTPRPKHYLSRLDLGRFLASPAAAEQPSALRPIEDDDWQTLPGLFAAAFHFTQPFASLNEEERLEAARACLAKTRAGGDGPLLSGASFIAGRGEGVCGATLITLLPGGDPLDAESLYWPTPVPEALWDSCAGQPHLTWVFVGPGSRERGLATALLRASCEALRRRGHAELWSTFMSGNDASSLWHWRRGFELLPRRGRRGP